MALLSGQIAQFVIPADGLGGQNAAVMDWPNNTIYFWGNDAVRKYATTPFATQYQVAIQTTFPWGSSGPLIGATVAVDAAGSPLVSSAYSTSIVKLNRTTLAVTATYGGSGSYPASIGATNGQVPSIVCMLAGGVPYAIVKEGVTSSNAGIIRTDTMTAAGFYDSVSAGLDGRSVLCGGQQGSTGLAFCADYAPSGLDLGIRKITIGPTAPSYNIASWPTPNPAITATLLRTIHATDINPSWTGIYTSNIAYDPSNNSLIVDLKNGSGGSQDVFIGIDASTGATLWTTPLGEIVSGATALAFLAHSQVPIIGNGSTAPPHTSSVFGITSSSGVVTTDTVNGLGTVNREQFSNDGSRTIIADVDYTGIDPSAPVPVAGTATAFNGWAMLNLWPFAPRTVRLAMDNVICGVLTGSPCEICLDWSNDRGHTFGNPVCQPFGDFLTSLQWQRLGMARDRVFRLTWYCAEHTALQGAWVTAITGDEDNEMAGQGGR